MQVYVLRRVAGFGEIDEIVNISTSPITFEDTGFSHLHLVALGATSEDNMEWEAVASAGVGDDSESVWVEKHNVEGAP